MTEDKDTDWMRDMVRDHYNPPPETPREEMWAALEQRLQGAATVSLDEARERKARRWGSPVWLAVAASAVLLAGVGLGRWSADTSTGPVAQTSEEAEAPRARRATAARMAAVEHLSRSEPLLTLVKSDVSRGAVYAEVAGWAEDLLRETRFLLDSGLPMDPEVASLLEDLELILLQATLVARAEGSEDRAQDELTLLGEGLEDRNVLPRIQALLPTAGLAGT